MCTIYPESPPIETIYFGGGTPSLLSPETLDTILHSLHSKFQICGNAEITLEANPDDISTVQLSAWKRIGINRLSIGVQSFFEEDLQWMNRAHNAVQSTTSIKHAREAGFDNLTIDLIYGLPALSDEKWKKNVQKVIELQVPHVSCYALTVEPKTALGHMIAKHKLQDMDAEQQARQFLQGIDWLEAAGYEHYEISNFSIPGKRSRHNTSYWQAKPYYGFGPSSHSFNGTDTRSWNIANNALYIQAITENKIPAEKELLTKAQRLNEYIMTSLRTMEGIDLNHIQKKFGRDFSERILVSAQAYHEKLILQNDFLKLTNMGKLFADGIAADLFVDEV